MAFIHKETFEIYDNCDIGCDNIADCDIFFEVDDLIAPIISKLNIKGYTTTHCCQGHPYNYFDSDIFDISVVFPKCYKLIGVNPISSTQTLAIYQTSDLKAQNIRTYIKFDEGIKLPNIPDDWCDEHYDKTVVLSKHFHQATPIGFFKALIEEIDKLDKWVDKLPVCVESSDQKWNWVVGGVLRKIPNLNTVEIEIIREAFAKGEVADTIIPKLVNFRN